MCDNITYNDEIAQLEKRRAKVYSWLENLAAAYENFQEFSEFKGTVNAKLANSNSKIIVVSGLKNLCDYADIVYSIVDCDICKFINIAYKGYIFMDDVVWKEDI